MGSQRAFGTAFGGQMSLARWHDGEWEAPALRPLAALELHPGAHALHYGSSCFEGLKAFRGPKSEARIFRLDRHVARMRASAEQLCLPVPGADMLTEMVVDAVRANLGEIPEPPGALYVRPTLIGTDPNIGAAAAPATEALLYVITSPGGDYFGGGLHPLRLAVETERPRTVPRFGSVKTGANYAMALGVTREARAAYRADQVLFLNQGLVQETGASNLVLLDEGRLLTPTVDGTFLEGVTRDSLLTLASDLGFKVEELPLTLDDLLAWAEQGEIALSGTAAVLAPVGTLVVDGADVRVGGGAVGATTLRLRSHLVDVQTGRAPAPSGWITEVR